MAAYPKEGRRMLRQLIVLLLAVLVSSACSSYTVPRYGLSAENITGLRKLGAKVNVGRFTATTPAQTEIRCRASGPVKTPDGRPFEDYIRRALVEELKVAEMLSDSRSEERRVGKECRSAWSRCDRQ